MRSVLNPSPHLPPRKIEPGSGTAVGAIWYLARAGGYLLAGRARTRHGPLILSLVFAVVWGLLALHPLQPQDWLLENLLTLGLVAWLLVSRRSHPLSTPAYALLLLYGLLHAIGAHYSYSLVPYREWLSAVFGGATPSWLMTSRNHYDRLLHFLFGLLCFRPMRETLRESLPKIHVSACLLTVCVLLSISTLYELLEWCVAATAGKDLGLAYVGAQGDIWDAQKDLALALVGSLLAMLISVLLAFRKEPKPIATSAAFETRVAARRA